MGFDDARIVFDREDKTYYPGDTVRGKLVFTQEGHVKKCRGIFMKSKGYCKVHWTTHHTRTVRTPDGKSRSERYTKDHNAYESYFEYKEYLVGNAKGEVQMHIGKHEIPFEVRIPRNCPSSYEASDGHIRYQIKFVADRAFKTDQEVLFTLNVLAKRDLNSDPSYREPINFELYSSFCCWCMQSGKCFVEVGLPASGYCPGDVVPIQVKCDNQSNVEIEHIKLELIEVTTFTTSDDTRKHSSTLAKIKKGPIDGNTQRSWTVEVEVPVLDPRNVDACKYIDVDYEFQVTLSPSGCHSDESDSSTIWLGHIPFNSSGVNDNEKRNEPVAPLQHQHIGGSPYPGAAPYPVTSPSPNPQYPGGTSPYPPPAPFPGSNSPYPGSNPSNSPYPPAAHPYSGPPPSNSPYPPPNIPYTGNPPSNSPYPPSNIPYPGNTPSTSPYPAGNANASYPNPIPNYGFNLPSTGSTPTSMPHPHQSPHQQTSPYPASSPAHPMPAMSLNPQKEDGSSMPSLPMGASVPYPITPQNPYAMASAPEPSTPDCDVPDNKRSE